MVALAARRRSVATTSRRRRAPDDPRRRATASTCDGAVAAGARPHRLRVEPGEFVALLGPSGCGKSTLLRLVAGLDRRSAGASLVDGDERSTGPDPSRVVVFQDPTLYPWRTVWGNVALGPGGARTARSAARARRRGAGAWSGSTGFANAYPHQLSGGMAQRAALARALVNDPQLLILDEPLGKLDSLTRLTMQGELVAAVAARAASPRCWSRTTSRRRCCWPTA